MCSIHLERQVLSSEEQQIANATVNDINPIGHAAVDDGEMP
jgi:hypothetical protein